MKKLIIPRRLVPGDTIGIVCPSAGIHPKAIHRIIKAKSCLEQMGYKVKLGNSIISDGESYVSGTVEERVADIHDMFCDNRVRMILTGIGGNHSNHLLRSLDFDLIRKNPKIVIGYSDITVLHYAIFTQSGLATYYGPCAATQFGEHPTILPYTEKWFKEACVDTAYSPDSKLIKASDAWTDEFQDWFKKLDLLRPRKMLENKGYHWINEGSAKGEALPACIMSMNRLAGTPYWIDPTNKILILDLLISQGELDEPMVDSFLTDLKNIGVFDVIKGLIIGRPYGYSNDAKKRLYKYIEILTGNKYPIVSEFDIGHTDPMVTVRYGQKIKLDSTKNLIKFLD